VLDEVASRVLDRFCSFKKHPELVLLKKTTEDVGSLAFFDGEKWIIRWINFMLKRNGEDNVDIDNEDLIRFNKDFMKILGLLKKRNSIIMTKPNATKSDSAKAFIKIAKHQFNVDTPIEPEDFTNNNRFCQNYFAAQIFDKLNGLVLTEEMKQTLLVTQDGFEGFNDSEREAVIAWLNSFGLRNRVDNLNDISSGLTLLKVLDRLKKGSVEWKRVHLKVRHKFDHVINCNYVVDVCQKQLGLKFVNISGMDVVDKNNSIIKSLLWQIMRYQSVKILSDLQFGSKIDKVNNSEIIKWCNAKLVEAFDKNIKCKQIKRLNDSSLSTGLYYLELIRSIMPNSIDESLINYNVPPLSSQIKKDFHLHDKHYKARRENLKYCMTIIRRYGVDLFINVDDLFRLEQRAVVSILAALMTIALSQQHLINKEEEEVEQPVERQEEEDDEEDDEKEKDEQDKEEEVEDEADTNERHQKTDTQIIISQPPISPTTPATPASPQSPEPAPYSPVQASNASSTSSQSLNKMPSPTPGKTPKSPSKSDKKSKSAKSNKADKSNASRKGNKAKTPNKSTKSTASSSKGGKGKNKGKGGNEKKSNKKAKKVKTPDMMENIDDIDFDSVLDEVDSSYKKLP